MTKLASKSVLTKPESGIVFLDMTNSNSETQIASIRPPEKFTEVAASLF